MSQMDASFILDDRFQEDLVTVSWEEKEVLSEYMEKYLYRAFENRVAPDLHLDLYSDIMILIFSFNSVLPAKEAKC